MKASPGKRWCEFTTDYTLESGGLSTDIIARIFQLKDNLTAGRSVAATAGRCSIIGFLLPAYKGKRTALMNGLRSGSGVMSQIELRRHFTWRRGRFCCRLKSGRWFCRLSRFADSFQIGS